MQVRKEVYLYVYRTIINFSDDLLYLLHLCFDFYSNFNNNTQKNQKSVLPQNGFC
jgi:hypothetical protein